MKNNHIYYLHGSLFLFDNGIDSLKIRRLNDNWLLDLITQQINRSNYPLFISEGTSESKLKQINSNQYLSYCFEKLKSDSSENLIIYGQSLGEQDKHLAELIDHKFKKVAISIKTEFYDTMGYLKAERNRLASLFNIAEIEFYNATDLFNFN
ncbi:DUF4917 family protein [Mangrovivirga cuniculi]|uniref:DUF4917 family protein n=1 Tax=Mangrovivirga cuniculi TaxID=2715131 RepID=UPI001C306D07|nr:DUF4917 family protein [Mangrovivirga cuniculi]